MLSDHKGHFGASVAIGVTTYNRQDVLEKFVESFRRTTSLPHDFLIADDGSTDGTLDWCADQKLPVIGGTNRGVAWNKNRLLAAFSKFSMAGVIILMDDDCLPSEPGWDEVWVRAAEKWGHVNALNPETLERMRQNTAKEIIGGAGTPEDPYRVEKISGICIATSRIALNRVGYLDTRFKGYGHEHAEWTIRFHRLGYGVHREIVDGKRRNYNLSLSHGLTPIDAPSASDKSTVSANLAIKNAGKTEQVYRLPWRSEDERKALMDELAAIAPA